MSKTGCTSCTKWTISFEVSGFWTKTHQLQKDFKILNIFQLKTFSAFIMHHSKPHHHFSNLFWLHLLFFMHFMIYFELRWSWMKSTANELWNGWKLAWYHNFTHIACAKKLRGLRQKLDALHVQTGQSPSKYRDFGRKLVYYKGISFF